MTETRKKYAKKLKYKKVVFSLKNKDLFEFANEMNFNAFVIEQLRFYKNINDALNKADYLQKGSEKDG